MIIYRGLFLLFALGLSYGVCKYLSLDLYQYLTVMAFIVSLDTAFTRWVGRQYMIAVMDQVNKGDKDNGNP